jgi:glycosyltransferase involved in cell wall biosynthesis
MRVLHVSFSDLSGGAGRAAFRIHRAMIGAGMKSEMLVLRKLSGDSNVHELPRERTHATRNLRPRLGSLALRLQRACDDELRSLNFLPSRLARNLNARNADMVNLHWIGSEMMSISDVANVSKPVVWTLHDMWPFCGAEHYAADGALARFRAGYHPGNRCAGSGGLDLDRWTWARKRTLWTRPIHLICPSSWMAQCASESGLMAGWPLDVIPYPIDLSTYSPQDRNEARQALGIPLEAKVVLFGAARGVTDSRKGFAHLAGAVRHLKRELEGKGLLVAFGGDRLPRDALSGFPVLDLGHIGDERRLASLYSAADVFVAPSEMDNLPNTVIEALACGVPVVAFEIGGMTDMVTMRCEGYLAQPFDPLGLAAGIRWVLGHSEPAKLREAARARAVRMFDAGTIAARYRAVYERVYSRYGTRQ